METDITVERFIDCAAAAAVLGGVHPKTVERWAREGRIPAYRYFRHWKFRASELEVWVLRYRKTLEDGRTRTPSVIIGTVNEYPTESQAKQAIEAIDLQFKAPPGPIKKDRRAFLIVKRTNGWYVADKAGPFKTCEAARTEREKLKNNQQETPKKTA